MESDTENDEKPTNATGILRTFGEATSGHGWPRVVGTKNVYRKLFWFLICLGGIGVSVWQISLLFLTFFDFPYTTKVEMRFEVQPFPAVTICNQNQFRASQLKEGGPEFEAIIEGYMTKMKDKMFKQKRTYRILALDHDMLSFTDQTFDHWPVVLITNPKHAHYITPRHEPSLRMRKSTHIRLLLFSPDDIVYVDVTVDKQPIGSAQHVKGPLYVLPWNPWLYSKGLHEITVSVRDSAGRQATVAQPFTLDNTPHALSGYVRAILMLDLISIAKIHFYCMFLLSILPLLLLRYLYRDSTVTPTDCYCLLVPVKAMFEWTKCLSQANKRIFWAVMLNNCYVAIGPWFIGEILEGHVGFVFVHGLYINSSYIPGSLTFVYGFLQIVFINIPFMLYIGRCLKLSQQYQQFKKPYDTTKCNYLYNHWPFYLLILLQAYLAVTGFYMPYGSMAFFLGPIRTWSIVFFIFVRRWALNYNVTEVKSS